MPGRFATIVLAFWAAAAAGCASPPRAAMPVALTLLTPPNQTSEKTADQLFDLASKRAETLAAQPYAPPADPLPAPFRNLDYDAFRKLRPRPETALWNTPGEPFAVLPLPRGLLYRDPVNVSIADQGRIEPLTDTDRFVDFVDFPQATADERRALGVSGFRIISQPGVAGAGYEFAVFQGASYFRIVGEGGVYGVSARALAIATGAAEAEEFPRFTNLWIVRPQAGDDAIALVALIDSPSIAGAYRFVLRPGLESIVDVKADLHPRREIENPGLAPMSSMYLHGSADRGAFDDFRPEVHDSDGLSVITASGEQQFRSLSNPTTMQVSGYDGSGVKSFGFEQRRRSFDSYGDLEAKYERRPSAWVEPGEGWGEGRVQLVELPTRTEYEDNVAAFWRPAQPWRASQPVRLSYRLHFGGEPSGRAHVGRVVSTRAGASPADRRLRRFVVDFAGAPAGLASAAIADVSTSAGVISNVTLIESDAPDHVRLSFDLDPKGTVAADLRAVLRSQTTQTTEAWLFRWTPE